MEIEEDGSLWPHGKSDWRSVIFGVGEAPVDLYVMTDGQQVKVGISLDAEGRRAQLQADRKTPICLCYTAKVSGSKAVIAEGFVHWLLRPMHVSGEWFSATVHQAINAVEAGAAAVTFRDDLPSFCASAHWRSALIEDREPQSKRLRSRGPTMADPTDDEDGSL
jgi:hypothetical protein